MAGDARTPGTAISNSMAYSKTPSPPDMGMSIMEVPGSGNTGSSTEFSTVSPTTQFGGWYSTMNISEWEVPLPTVEAPTEPPYEPEQPPVTLLTSEELKALIEGGQSNVATMVNEQSAEGEQSAALECLLDPKYSLAVEAAQDRDDTGLGLPTRKDFEGPLCALPNNLSSSAESEHDIFMGEAGAEDINKVVDRFLDDGREGFVDFECPERV